MIKEKIIGALEGEDEEDVEKNMLNKFGFVYISGIGSRHDGSIVIDVLLTENEGKDCELWVDYKNKRVLVYKFGDDLYFLDGDLTKKEVKIYYN
ncbi:MAG: hypothetical protein KAU90_00955 [Sulfurovaceae bacterium]|nr:hypothetical protein [Sulfurovaceae bacterium]